MNFYYPTKDEEDKILKEIGYSRSQLERDIPALRLWLQEQVHLPESRLKENDIFLSNFLVGCKGSVETAKRKMDHYYSLRGKGEAFTNRDTFAYVDSVSKYLAMVDIPKPTPEGNCISMTQLLVDDVDQYDGVDTLKKMTLMFELKLRTVPISGQHIYILDAHNYTMAHFLKLPPSALRTFTSFFQVGFQALEIIFQKQLLVRKVKSFIVHRAFAPHSVHYSQKQVFTKVGRYFTSVGKYIMNLI
uniref:Elongation factor G n=1 Tax=Lygus hesperus TaxID=30085 RepID=A0A0A9ZD49_LYGHE